MRTKEKIKEILTKTFFVHHLEIIDDSAKHAGHSAQAQRGESHFSIIIVSDNFEGVTLVKRHKIIYEALKTEMKQQIHALALKVLTIKEFRNSNI